MESKVQTLFFSSGILLLFYWMIFFIEFLNKVDWPFQKRHLDSKFSHVATRWGQIEVDLKTLLFYFIGFSICFSLKYLYGTINHCFDLILCQYRNNRSIFTIILVSNILTGLPFHLARLI
jgi:hypothetical protein